MQRAVAHFSEAYLPFAFPRPVGDPPAVDAARPRHLHHARHATPAVAEAGPAYRPARGHRSGPKPLRHRHGVTPPPPAGPGPTAAPRSAASGSTPSDPAHPGRLGRRRPAPAPPVAGARFGSRHPAPRPRATGAERSAGQRRTAVRGHGRTPSPAASSGTADVASPTTPGPAGDDARLRDAARPPARTPATPARPGKQPGQDAGPDASPDAGDHAADAPAGPANASRPSGEQGRRARPTGRQGSEARPTPTGLRRPAREQTPTDGASPTGGCDTIHGCLSSAAASRPSSAGPTPASRP